MTDFANIDFADIMQRIGYGSIPDAISQVFQTTSGGEIDAAIGNNFYGIDHRSTPGAVPINKDFFGLTFFTRPRFNLTTANLLASRQLAPLLTTQPASVQRAIRCLLDHQLVTSGIKCPLVDDQQAFIPLLTNNLLSINGWPDVKADLFMAPAGVYKEEFGFVDSVAQDYSSYDITADFRNMPGNPITLLFFTWIHYMSLVYQGIMVPYFDAILENEIDYNTRIYRLVLDSTKTKVQGIAACGASLPVSAPMGAMFNYSHDRPVNQANDQISINFRCFGAMYQDYMLIAEFNRTVVMFNDTMGDQYRSSMYTLVPIDFLEYFNFKGYPRINPDTQDLEWWVLTQDFNTRMAAITNQTQRYTSSLPTRTS